MDGYTLTVGFDGFVDTIARPILQTASATAEPQYYPTIHSLGTFLQQQEGKSCSIELEVSSKRAGGNAPLLSAGAAALGMRVSCVGTLGTPQPDPVFADLPARLYSFGEPGASTALEFDDGKVFLAPSLHPDGDVWELVQEAAEGHAAELFAQADACALVNWSELSFSHALWEKVYSEALAGQLPDKSRLVLFDLADCSRRRGEEIDRVLHLIGRYSSRRRTLLSLNENEAEVIALRLLARHGDLMRAAADIREKYGIDEVVVHTRHESLMSSGQGDARVPMRFVEKPVRSTGAGDHFNAALCHATLYGWADEKRLAFAGAFVHEYLRRGSAPTLAEIELED